MHGDSKMKAVKKRSKKNPQPLCDPNENWVLIHMSGMTCMLFLVSCFWEWGFFAWKSETILQFITPKCIHLRSSLKGKIPKKRFIPWPWKMVFIPFFEHFFKKRFLKKLCQLWHTIPSYQPQLPTRVRSLATASWDLLVDATNTITILVVPRGCGQPITIKFFQGLWATLKYDRFSQFE